MSAIELDEDNYKSPEVRVRRIANQREWDLSHEHTFGLSFRERSALIRKHIYKGYDSVVGYKPEQTRDRGLSVTACSDMGEIEIRLVPGDEVESCFEMMADLIDGVYQCLRMQQVDRESGVMRMIGVFNALGILIHPYADANGQYLRMLSLSYLHELVPKTSTLFFPYRRLTSGDLFGFDMGPFYVEDPNANPEEIGKEWSKIIQERTYFLLGEDGQKLLFDYIFDFGLGEIDEIVARYDPVLQIQEIFENIEKVAVNIQKSFKHYSVLEESLAEALDIRNQVQD